MCESDAHDKHVKYNRDAWDDLNECIDILVVGYERQEISTHDTGQLKRVCRSGLIDDGGNEKKGVQDTSINGCTHNRVDCAVQDTRLQARKFSIDSIDAEREQT